MLRAQNKGTAAFTVFCRMPLLTELGSRKDGFCYKHGAPSGAVRAGSGSIPLKTRKNLYRASDSGFRTWDLGGPFPIKRVEGNPCRP
jgi:hypothetical protein